MEHHPYQTLASLVSYPAGGFKRTVDHDLPALFQKYPEESETLKPYCDYVRTKGAEELQELYTKTFDVQAICFLDIGYVLFGEDYKRGEFLVYMNREHAKVGNSCGTELPDHLPNVLNLLPKLTDPEFTVEFIQTFLIPALEKMLSGFKENGNIYAGPLKATLNILKKDFTGGKQ